MGKRGPLPKNNLPTVDYPSATANKPSKEDIERQRRYKAEDALRDIERAEGHKKDKELMSDIKSLAKEKMASLKKIC